MFILLKLKQWNSSGMYCQTLFTELSGVSCCTDTDEASRWSPVRTLDTVGVVLTWCETCSIFHELTSIQYLPYKHSREQAILILSEYTQSFIHQILVAQSHKCSTFKTVETRRRPRWLTWRAALSAVYIDTWLLFLAPDFWPFDFLLTLLYCMKLTLFTKYPLLQWTFVFTSWVSLLVLQMTKVATFCRTVFQKSDAKIEITITTSNLIRIKHPLSSFNYHLPGGNIANFNKIHRTVSEQQLFKKWNSKTEISNLEKSP